MNPNFLDMIVNFNSITPSRGAASLGILDIMDHVSVFTGGVGQFRRRGVSKVGGLWVIFLLKVSPRINDVGRRRYWKD